MKIPVIGFLEGVGLKTTYPGRPMNILPAKIGPPSLNINWKRIAPFTKWRKIWGKHALSGYYFWRRLKS